MCQLAYKAEPTLSLQQIRAAIQAVGGEKVLQKEAAEAISRFGKTDGSNGFSVTNFTSIAKMAAIVGGEVIDVTPADTDGIGVPAHVLVRRGSHFNYQFIYIFGTESPPATNNLSLELIEGATYLRNTAKKN
jgi:hypothetical protein